MNLFNELECLNIKLFNEELKDFSSSNVICPGKIQEGKGVFSFLRGKEWSFKQFILSIEGSLSLGYITLKQLQRPPLQF